MPSVCVRREQRQTECKTLGGRAHLRNPAGTAFVIPQQAVTKNALMATRKRIHVRHCISQPNKAIINMT